MESALSWGTFGGDLREWTIGGATRTLWAGNGPVSPIAISPDETIVATSGVHASRVCRISTSEPACDDLKELGEWGSSVTFSEGGGWFGAASGGMPPIVREIATGREFTLGDHSVSSIKFDRSGTDEAENSVVTGATGKVTDGQITQDGHFVFITDDGSIWKASFDTESAATKVGQHFDQVFPKRSAGYYIQ
jgi:hypothetical protein